MSRTRRSTRRSLVGFVLALICVGVHFSPPDTTHSLPQAVLDAAVEPALVGYEPLPAMEWATCMWVPRGTAHAASREDALYARSAAALLAAQGTSEVDRAPVRTIWDDKPTYSAVAVDPKRDEVILQDENLFQILVYDRLDNTPPRATMTEPKRWIGGLETKIEFNCGLYVDPASGDIYSVPNDTVDTLVVFSRDAQGDVAPDRELSTPHGTYGIAVDEATQEMFLTVQHDNAVVVYRKTAEGDEAPLREIAGDRTQLEDPHGVAVDSQRGLLFVINYGNARSDQPGSGTFELPSISVYPKDAQGNVAPLRVIEGDKTQMNWPAGMAVHAERGELFVANDAGHSILVFRVTDEGNVAPSRVLKGPTTTLKNPTGVSVDPRAGELWVSNFGNHSATVFSVDATGDVPPLRTIRAAPKGEQALGIGNPGAVAYDTQRREILVPN